jgi:formylglycine-generating enzyme required for sulfatase activity
MTHLKSEFHAIRSDDGFVFSAPVGMFHPNAWGLFDMHGNISEVCEDLYTSDYYENSPEVDPTGPATNRISQRVNRGGGWRAAPGDARSGNRINVPDDYRYSYIGFRVVIESE